MELFIFPDGTAVEMIVFAPQRAPSQAAPSAPDVRARRRPGRARGGARRHAARRRRRHRRPARQLDGAAHRCPLCGSDLVYPVDWERNCEASWNLLLRCPNCETQRRVVARPRRRRDVQPRDLPQLSGARAGGRLADQAQLLGGGGEARRGAGPRPHPADGLLAAPPPLFVSHTPATTTTAASACPAVKRSPSRT